MLFLPDVQDVIVSADKYVSKLLRSNSHFYLSPKKILSHLRAGGRVNLSHLNRRERLNVINNFLTQQNLRSLEGVGEASKGEMEFIGINKFSPDKFVSRIDFQAVVGKGKEKLKFNHLSFISSNTAMGDGAIIVPFISTPKMKGEPYVVLVRQYRAVLGRETIELARGFPDMEDFLSSKPMKTALRELEEETGIVSRDCMSFDIQEMKPVYENTSTHNVRNSVYKIKITVTKEDMAKLSNRVMTEDFGHKLKTLLVPASKAFNMLEDNHSISALARCTM